MVSQVQGVCLLLAACTFGRITSATSSNVIICPGAKLTVSELGEYQKMNCTVIEGSLELRSELSYEAGNIISLDSVVQITGSLSVSYLQEEAVDNLGQILPNLAVIRSEPAYRTPHGQYGLYLTGNRFIVGVGLRSLTHILTNDSGVLLWENRAMVYGGTVDWESLLSPGIAAVRNDRGSGRCNETACNNCWSENVCQRALPEKCSAVDENFNCTCHQECLSRCYGSSASDCLACRKFYFNGTCVPSCPPGLLEHGGWRCVERCPDRVMKVSQSKWERKPTAEYNGICVEECPLNHTMDIKSGTCIPCNDTCEKRCKGGVVRSLKDARKFEGCKHVEGSLIINVLIGDGKEYETLTAYLGGIERIEDYVIVKECPNIRSLTFLQNLKEIRGIKPFRTLDHVFGLVVISNQNLRNLTWDKRKNLSLGSNIDLKILVMQNPWLCLDDLKQLEMEFRWTVVKWSNGYRGACNPLILNASISSNGSCMAALQWDGVPPEREAHLSQYELLWTRFEGSEDNYTIPEEFDEQNPESCASQKWTLRSLGDRNTVCLDDVLLPWHMVAVQVRAHFEDLTTGAKTRILPVHGHEIVPSCPIHVKETMKTHYTISLQWFPPVMYPHTVTGYVIFAISTTGSTRSLTSNDTSMCQDESSPNDNQSCDAHNTPGTVEKSASCSAERGCEATLYNLTNFRLYSIEIRANNSGGCGVASRSLLVRTKAAPVADVVSNITVSVKGQESTFSERVEVRWLPPKKPNGAVESYQLRLDYDITPEEAALISEDVVVSVFPSFNNDNCQYKLGLTNKFISCSDIMNTTVTLSLFRVSGRELQYNLTVVVKSAAGRSDFNRTTSFYVSAASHETDDGINVTMVAALSGISGVLVLVTVCMGLYVTHLKVRKRRLRVSLKHQMKLSISRTPTVTAIDFFPGSYEPDEWEVNREEIVLDKELGKGAFGCVYSGKWLRGSGEDPIDVAVKTLSDDATDMDRLTFLKEASLMKHLHSEDVVKLYGIVSISNPVLVVMELMEYGDLKSYLRSLRPENGESVTTDNYPMSDDCIQEFASQIACGMVYLSQMKLVHRDLAARNCMVTSNLRVKIGDFGLSRSVYQSDYYRKIGHGPLPVRWMSPESLRDGLYDQASDVWSYGIVLWEIITLGVQPYPGMTNEEVFKFVVGGGIMDLFKVPHAPAIFILLMQRCWLFSPKERPTFKIIRGCLPGEESAV